MSRPRNTLDQSKLARTMNVYLPTALVAHVDDYADAHEMSRSEVTRLALMAYLDTPEAGQQ